MTALKFILQWTAMLALIAFAAAGAAWAVVWTGEHVMLHAEALSKLGTFLAFWLIVGCLVRIAWHLGSKFKAQETKFNAQAWRARYECRSVDLSTPDMP